MPQELCDPEQLTRFQLHSGVFIVRKGPGELIPELLEQSLRDFGRRRHLGKYPLDRKICKIQFLRQPKEWVCRNEVCG
jgi:hypothetical protein